MESCLLCLKLHSDKVSCIRTDSASWMELNIANTIEKHFWPLNTIRSNSFICSPCWRMVDEFHKFYLLVEEAHMKIIIKVESENVNDFCFQKPGRDQTIDEVNTDVDVRNELLDINEDTESMSNISRKQFRGSQKDGLTSQNMTNLNPGKCRKRKCSMDQSLEIKKKVSDNNHDLECISDIDEDNIDLNSKLHTNIADNADKDAQNDYLFCEENDNLIRDYLKQINCSICKVQLETFAALHKHSLEIHKQRGYILCCNRKFFKQKDLADHIHCHLNPNYFRCDQCDKMFADRKFLEQHELHDHNLEESAKRYSCDGCSKLFLNIQSLKKHKMSHLPRAETNNLCKERNKCSTSTIENNFEEPPVANSEELNANHSTSPNMSYTLLTDFFEPLPSSQPSSSAKNDVQSEEIFAMLKEIARAQKECNTRLQKLEQNQTKMMHQKSMLSNGQVVIVNNQQQIADSIDKLVSSIVPNPDMITQAQLLTECKVSIKKVEESVCGMTDKTCNNRIKEIARMLPLQSLEAVEEVEHKLESTDFAQTMMAYLHKAKGASEDVSSVIRTIFTDDLLEKFNWEGRWEKKALGKLTLFNKTLRDVFHQQKSFEFEKSVRKAVERSHHRMQQKKYLKKENK